MELHKNIAIMAVLNHVTKHAPAAPVEKKHAAMAASKATIWMVQLAPHVLNTVWIAFQQVSAYNVKPRVTTWIPRQHKEVTI